MSVSYDGAEGEVTLEAPLELRPTAAGAHDDSSKRSFRSLRLGVA